MPTVNHTRPEAPRDALTGKVALVTGASSGLGRAVAELLHRRGATVLGVARDASALASAMSDITGDPSDNRYFAADIGSSEACADAVAACVARFGGLDLLINVAGAHTLRHSHSVTDEEWADDLAVNLNGPFYLSRAAIPHLLERRGNIVNVASIAGVQGQAYSAGYCAAKHALIGLTRALAVEYSGSTLRVNAVCPGGMTTPLVAGFTFPEGVDFDLVLRSAAPRGLMRPEDVAALICFLASDDAAAIHGSVHLADNGKTAG
ncbi:SDR family NAD(P)-dependent oxidoreductase [Tomitella biformata]|uniref:SDR family NAD(P)-dependent oxidoreductase n=1 Tax=Tomitella biformata TaxID=630403 RepID=UPI0004661066|nr:SDR family oxidoreductase [Tomitella biformata]